MLAPLAGGLIALAATTFQIVGMSLRRRVASIHAIRNKVEKALVKSDKKIIVLLDDLDRLTPAEVREVFKLVRLTAAFPNVIYIVACDREQVETALSEQGIRGNDYLDKIIQLPYRLPEIPLHKLKEHALTEIQDAVGAIERSSIEEDTWSGIRDDIVLPLIRNLRDVRRYSAAIRGTLTDLDGKVALADVLGLEAIRVFLPYVFHRLPGVIESVTYPPIADAISDNGHIDMALTGPTNTLEVDDWKRELTVKQRDVIDGMLRHLFPATTQEEFHYGESTERASRELRVACRAILRLYLEYVEGDEVMALWDAKRALKFLHNSDAIEKLFGEIHPPRWRYVVAQLSGYPTEEFRRNQVEPGVAALWTLLEHARIDDVEYEPLRKAVMKATRTLFRALDGDTNAKAKDSAACRILSRLPSLGAKVLFLEMIGNDEGNVRIASASAAARLESSVWEELGECPVDDLMKERHLLAVVEFFHDPRRGRSFVIPDSPEVTWLLVYQSKQDWTRLEKLFGTRAVLRTRVEDLVRHRDDLTPWIEDQAIATGKAEHLFDRAHAWLNVS